MGQWGKAGSVGEFNGSTQTLPFETEVGCDAATTEATAAESAEIWDRWQKRPLSGMPQYAIETGRVDFVGRPLEIALALVF